MVTYRQVLDHAALAQPARCIDGSNIAAGNGGSARAAVRLDHVAVDVQRAFAEQPQVEHGPQAATDESLDLVRATALLASRGLAIAAGVRCARQHAVLRSEPALSLAFQETGDFFLNARGADHAGVAKLDQDGAFCVLGVTPRQAYRAQFVRAAPAGSCERG